MFNVFVATDFHFWNGKNNAAHPFVTESKLGRLAANYAKDIQVGDIFICLGDLCDPEVTDMSKLRTIFQSIPGYKVLCRGNHDTQDDSFYLDAGFDAVCDICKIHSIVFSHYPVRVAPDMINIHGDDHMRKQTVLGYRHINAYDKDNTEHPILVDDLLANATMVGSGGETRPASDEDMANNIYRSIPNNVAFSNILDLSDKVSLYPMDEGAGASNIYAAMDLQNLQTPQDLYKWMRKNIRYGNFTRLKTDVELLKTRSGSCHDQVFFAYPRLRQMGVNPQILYFVEYKEGENTGGMTHTLIYWKNEHDDGVTWFENSWRGQQGIHKFNSLNALKEYIEDLHDNMPSSSKFPDLYFKAAPYSRFRAGMTLQELVESIMGDNNLNESTTTPVGEFSLITAESVSDDIQHTAAKYIAEFRDLIGSPCSGLVMISAPQSDINKHDTGFIFGGMSKQDGRVYVIQQDDIPSRIPYELVLTAVGNYVLLRDMNPNLSDDHIKGIAYWSAHNLIAYMDAGTYTLAFDIYHKECHQSSIMTHCEWVERMVHNFGQMIIRSLANGIVSPLDAESIRLEENAQFDRFDPMSEIIFDDIDDTKYWLADDDAEPKTKSLDEKAIKFVNDEGKAVPKECPECGSKVGVFLKGEPVFLCSNKKCGKYFGTVPCDLNETIGENFSEFPLALTKYPEWCNEAFTQSSLDKDYVGKGKKSLSSFKQKVCDEGEFSRWYEKFSSELKHVRSNENSTVTLWLTKDESELVAYICLEEKGEDMCIQALEVLPEYRGYGLSDQLMTYAKNNGATLLYVNPENQIALKLYKKHGWKFGKNKNRGTLQPMILRESIFPNTLTLTLSDKIPNAEEICARVNALRSIIKSPIQNMTVETVTTAEFRGRFDNPYIFGTYDPDADRVYLIYPYEVPHEINYEDLAVHEICHAVLYYANPNLDEETQEAICIGYAGKHYEQLVKLGNRLNDPGYYNEYTEAISFVRENFAYYGHEIFNMLAHGDMSINESQSVYRFTYDGRGIYDELKNAMPFEDWKKLKKTNTLSWLPVPDVYGQSDVKYTSFFTDVGKRNFERKVLPVVAKYLDKDKVVLTKYSLKNSDDIAYSDKYQTVIPMDSVDNTLQLLNEAATNKKPHKLTVKTEKTSNPNDTLSSKAVDLTFYDGNDKVGECSVSSIDTDRPFLYNLEVFKKYRGKGYSHDIMKYVLSHYKIFELTVDKDNEIAIELYKKHGFKLYCEFKDGNEWVYDMRIDCSDPIPKDCKPISEAATASSHQKDKNKLANVIKTGPFHRFYSPKVNRGIYMVCELLGEEKGMEILKPLNDLARELRLNINGIAKHPDAVFWFTDKGYKSAKSAITKVSADLAKEGYPIKHITSRGSDFDTVYLASDYEVAVKMKTSKHITEAAAELQGLDRKQQEDVSKKYGIKAVGHDDPIETPEKRVDEKREKQLKNLKRARKIKKRKAFVRKIKSKLPGNKTNEDADISDIPANYGEENFFDKYASAFDFENETGYKFALAENIKFMDSITESADNDDKLYPVYIMLMHSGTMLANAIKTVTNSHFSHSSISFDSSMRSMYSFGRKKNVNPIVGAFKQEDIKDDFFKGRTVPYALYVVPCTKSEVDLMKKRLNYFIKNATKFRYDFTGLFKNYFGIADNPEYRWFCSRFVADILNAGKPSSDPYVVEPSLMKPEDFLYTNFATYVTGGMLDAYDQAYVDKVTRKILRVEQLRRRKAKKESQNESFILDIDPFDPLAETVLEYHLSMLDETAIGDFFDYLKSFKIRFDKDGNVIITRREYDQLDKHFRQSLRMIKAYEKADDLESVKQELCKIYYMIELINKHYLNPANKQNKSVKSDIRKEMMDLRSVMLNVFQQHLKYVTIRDPRFNFNAYYSKSKYSNTVEIPNSVISAIGKAILTKL